MAPRRMTAAVLLAALAAPTAAAAQQGDLASCLSGLRAEAAGRGISPAAFDGATRGSSPTSRSWS
jgi:membrane-bound lytic murein transglycosylase B